MHTSTLLKYILSALIASAAMAGCATKTPMLDDHFGEAVNAAKAQQTINPDASTTNAVVFGVDGAAADAAVDTYHKSFTQPPPSVNVFNIGVGNTGGMGNSSSSSGTR